MKAINHYVKKWFWVELSNSINSQPQIDVIIIIFKIKNLAFNIEIRIKKKQKTKFLLSSSLNTLKWSGKLRIICTQHFPNRHSCTIIREFINLKITYYIIFKYYSVKCRNVLSELCYSKIIIKFINLVFQLFCMCLSINKLRNINKVINIILIIIIVVVVFLWKLIISYNKIKTAISSNYKFLLSYSGT